MLQVNYTIIGPPDDQVFGINDSGQVAGVYDTSNEADRSFVYSDGLYTPIQVPESFGTDTQWIDNAGDMVGYYTTDGGISSVFLYRDGEFTDIRDPNAFGVNDSVEISPSGQVYGNYLDASNVSHGYLYSDGSFYDFDYPGTTGGTTINDISGSGIIAGHYSQSSQSGFSFIDDAGVFTTIADPSGAGTTAIFAVNDSGTVVGDFYDSSGTAEGYIYQDGQFTNLSYPGAIYTSVSDINNNGQAIGDYEDASGIYHGYLYQNGQYASIGSPGGGGTFVYQINDAGEITGADFAYQTGFVATVEDVACYCPGTLILTDHGEVQVEALKIGDSLITLSGQPKPIRWIGRRSYTGRFAAGKPHILPVCIRAGVLGPNLPARDLWVSPAHALFLDEMLVPVSALVDGRSIVQAERVESVTYIHIEFEQHEVVFAEGVPAESFLDDDCRGMFQNAHEFALLYPHAIGEPAKPYAPRVEDGFGVEAIRDRIAARRSLAAFGATDPPRLSALG